MVSKQSRSTNEVKKGIGLFTYEQAKNTTPFQYLAQVVVGIVFFLAGGLLVYHVTIVRGEEIRAFGSPEMHLWDWSTSLAMMIIGVFMAHAGIIFYARRIIKEITISFAARKSAGRRKVYRD
jgi:hypothetical protein